MSSRASTGPGVEGRVIGLGNREAVGRDLRDLGLGEGRQTLFALHRLRQKGRQRFALAALTLGLIFLELWQTSLANSARDSQMCS